MSRAHVSNIIGEKEEKVGPADRNRYRTFEYNVISIRQTQRELFSPSPVCTRVSFAHKTDRLSANERQKEGDGGAAPAAAAHLVNFA